MNACHKIALSFAFSLFFVFSSFAHAREELPQGNAWDWPNKRELTATQQGTLEERLAEVRSLQEKKAAIEKELEAAQAQFAPTQQRISEALEKIDELEGVIMSIPMHWSGTQRGRDESKAAAAASLKAERDKIPGLIREVRGLNERQVDAYIEYLLAMQRLVDRATEQRSRVGRGNTDAERAQRQAAAEQADQALQDFRQDTAQQRIVTAYQSAISGAREQVQRPGATPLRRINEIRSRVMEIDGELRGLHIQIGQLKGYEMGVGGMEALDLDSIMEGTDIPGLAWLDFEIAFIERLGERGYEDLATRYLELVRTSNHPETNRPLDDTQVNHLNKVAASLMMQQAFRSRDLADKITYANQAVELSRKIPELLVPNTIPHMDAVIDLSRTYFRLADHLADAAARELRAAGVDRPAPPPRPTTPAPSTPAADDDEEEGEIIWIEEEEARLDDLLRPGALVATAARHLPGATVRAATPVSTPSASTGSHAPAHVTSPQGMPVPGAGSAIGRSSSLAGSATASRLVLSPSADGSVGLQALQLAQQLYTQGMEVASPTQKRIKDTFEVLIDEYSFMLEEGDQRGADQKILPALSVYGARMVRIQRSMEDAYASWPSVYPVGSEQRLEIAEKGNAFVSANMGDYRAFWPDDKMGFVYWIGVLGHLVDPVVEWSGEEGDRVTPPPDLSYFDMDDPYDKMEYEREKDNPNRWRWPSDRVERIWEADIVNGRANAEHPDTNTQSHRVRAMYFYAQAKSNLAMTHRFLADRDKNPKMEAHAETLHEKAMAALNEGIKPNSIVGALDDTTRFNVRLKLRIDYFLFLAERAKKMGDDAQAGNWIMQAIAEAAAVQSEGSANWRVTAEQYLAGVVAFQERLGIHVSEDDIPPSVMITQADSLVADARSIRNPREKRAVLREAIDKYVEGIGSLRAERDRAARDAVLPKALFNLGIAAIQAEDFLMGYIANWELVQEFNDKMSDPNRRYPPERFSNAASYLPRAMRHLQYSAFHYNRQRNDSLSQGMYADALIRIAELKDSEDAGEEYVQLIDLLKRMQQYERAVNFIDNVPEDNLYYNLIQLMAADIWQTMMRAAIRDRDRLNRRLNPQKDEDGNIPPEYVLTDETRTALEAQKERLEGEISKYRDQAMAYSEKFIRLHLEARARWEAEAYAPADNVLRVRNQERRNLLQAMLIPIALDINEKNWESAYTRSTEYIEAVKAQDGVSEEDRREFLAQGNWLRFVSILSQGDFQGAPIEEGVAILEKSATEQQLLSEADVERKYLSDSAMMMGGAYMRLAGRVKSNIDTRREEGATDADVAPLTAQEGEFRLAAVNQFLKAEEALYQKGNAGLGISMMRTLINQQLFQEAEQIGQNVIAFWSESMFTPTSLYRGANVNAARVVESGIPDEMRQTAGPLFESIPAAARQGDDALLQALNQTIRTFNATAHADAVKQMIEQARRREESKQSHLQNRDHLQGLAQAERILARLQRGDETPDEIRFRLNRILLEAVFVDTLFQAPYKPLIPSLEEINELAERLQRSYTTRTAQPKAAILAAMLNPKTIEGRIAQTHVDGSPGADGTRQGGFREELRKQIAAAEDEAEKARLQRFERNFTEPLSLLIFGETNPRTGKIERRNFQRAAENIALLLEWDRKEDVGVELPIRSELREIRDALLFESTMVFAKMGYARAMVEVGKFIDAKAYLEELADYFPTMATIKIDLARAYTAMGAYQIVNGEVVPRPYDAEAAKNFMEARYRINEVLNIYRNPESSIYWDAWGQFFENGVTEITSRKQSPDGEMVHPVELIVFNPRTGAEQTVRRNSPELDSQANDLFVDLARMAASTSPAPPDEFIALADSLMEKLIGFGYERPEMRGIDDLVLDATAPPPTEPKEGEGESESESGDAADPGDAEVPAQPDSSDGDSATPADPTETE